MTVLDDRRQAKADLDAYKAAAVKRVESLFSTAPIDDGTTMQVTNNAHVHPAEGGAFVEVVMWVPKELLRWSRIISPFALEKALRAEGFPLPDECANVRIEMPVDGLMQIIYTVNMTSETQAMLGRALIRVGIEDADLQRRINAANEPGPF